MMKIIIKSIEAEIINVSTPEEDQILVNNWIVKYEIKFPLKYTHIEGMLSISTPDGIVPVNRIVKALYSMYNGMEDRINTEIRL